MDFHDFVDFKHIKAPGPLNECLCHCTGSLSTFRDLSCRLFSKYCAISDAARLCVTCWEKSVKSPKFQRFFMIFNDF